MDNTLIYLSICELQNQINAAEMYRLNILSREMYEKYLVELSQQISSHIDYAIDEFNRDFERRVSNLEEKWRDIDGEA